MVRIKKKLRWLEMATIKTRICKPKAININIKQRWQLIMVVQTMQFPKGVNNIVELLERARA